MKIEGQSMHCLGQGSNAFTVLMASGGTDKKGGSGGKRGSKSSSFPHPWQQWLYNIAMSPQDYVGTYKSMEYNESCVWIKDSYPKGRHHFLVVARDPSLEQPSDLRRRHCGILKRMLSYGEARTEHLRNLGVDFKLGFHSIPSMRQLHMHVISTDLTGTGLKHKKHWNSFTTKFFLDADRVVNALESDGQLVIDRKGCEDMLKENLKCFKCQDEFKTMPELKAHIVRCKTER